VERVESKPRLPKGAFSCMRSPEALGTLQCGEGSSYDIHRADFTKLDGLIIHSRPMSVTYISRKVRRGQELLAHQPPRISLGFCIIHDGNEHDACSSENG